MKKLILSFLLTHCLATVFGQAAAPELILPSGHIQAVKAVTFSPDGKNVITGSDDLTLRKWDASTGQELQIYRGAEARITTVRFSPNGKQFAVGCTNGQVLLWDFASGNLVKKINVHSDTVTCIDFFANDKFISSSKDRTAKIYDLNKNETGLVINENSYKINSVAYYPQGDFIITGGDRINRSNYVNDVQDAPAKFWNKYGVKEVDFAFGAFNIAYKTNIVGFSNDGHYAVAVGDGQGRIYDLIKDNKLVEKFNERADFGQMAPNGKSVLVGTDRRLKIVEIPSGKVIRDFKNPPSHMTSAAFSPDGNFIVVGLLNKAAVILDALSGEQVKLLAGRSGGVMAVTFSPYGQYLATGGLDGTAKLWDITTGELVKALPGQNEVVTCLAFSPDNKSLAVGYEGNKSVLYDIASGTSSLAIPYSGSAALVFSPDGKKLLTVNKESLINTICLFDLSSKKMIFSMARGLFMGGNRKNTSAVFSPDGKYVYVAGASEYPDKNTNNKTMLSFGGIYVFDTETGKYVKEFSDPQDQRIMSIDISKDGKTIVTSGNEKTLYFWNRSLGKLSDAYTDLHKSEVSAVSYSPDETQVLTAGYDKTAKLIDLATKQYKVFTGHTAEIFAAKFSPSGKYIVTASLDNTTRIWNVQTGDEIAKLIPIDNTEWLIITPEGYFDGSEKALSALYYTYKSNIYTLEQLKPNYYKKGLLPLLLGYAPGALPAHAPFSAFDIYPGVTLGNDINPKNPVLDIQLNNVAGVIGKVTVTINGKLAIADASLSVRKTKAITQDLIHIPVSLANSPLILWGQKNTIQVNAYNFENTLSGPAATISFDAPKKIK